jgi:hypothetical protein
MHQPEFAVRVEITTTDSDDLKEYRVIVGGMQRGGLSCTHGYMPTSGQEVEGHIEGVLLAVRSMLESYVCSFSTIEAKLPGV